MFEGMTAAQIREYIIQAEAAWQEAHNTEQTLTGERAARIQEAVDTLTALIGTEDGPPDLHSIRGVSRHSDQDIADNAVLTIRLILAGMEQLALTTRDIAQTVA